MPKLNFKSLTYCILGGGYKLAPITEIKEFKTTKISLVRTRLVSNSTEKKIYACNTLPAFAFILIIFI